MPNDSVSSITALNPHIPNRSGGFASDVLSEASRVLEVGGELVVAAQRSNGYVQIRKLTPELLEKFGFEVIQHGVPLTQINSYAARFGSVQFRNTTGLPIDPANMQAIVLRKR